ncbi:hypothetical protein [Virgibacillus halodenitrificans]|uniref:hypothetical protein n=1 Tax=Virgibacillus halodenitrificans TaxID=1482 RepID=UPI000EF440C9|nr:hypothetical protein [Virgibacillus halodenitrificans]
MGVKWRVFKEMVSKNKGLAMGAIIGIIVFLTLFIKMFIDLLPFLLLGLGAFIIYKLFKKGYLG